MPPLPRPMPQLVLLVRLLCAFGALVLVAVPVWLWLSPSWIAELSPQIAGVRDVTVNARTQALGAAASTVPVALGLYALWQLWRLFGCYADGAVFSREALTRLRRFAWALVAAAGVTPLFRAALSVLLTIGNPPGQRMLVIGLSWNDYLSLLLAVVLLAIATVMREAVRGAEENEGFV